MYKIQVSAQKIVHFVQDQTKKIALPVNSTNTKINVFKLVHLNNLFTTKLLTTSTKVFF